MSPKIARTLTCTQIPRNYTNAQNDKTIILSQPNNTAFQAKTKQNTANIIPINQKSIYLTHQISTALKPKTKNDSISRRKEKTPTWYFELLHSRNQPLLKVVPHLFSARRYIQVKSIIRLLLKISVSITISMESSRRDLSIDMVLDRFFFKNNENTLFQCFTFKNRTS